MNRLFAALVLAVPGWAYSSLTVAPGTSGILTVPGVAPFTSMGDYRVEFRIHDWTLPTSGSAAYLSWGSVYSGARYLEITFSSAGKLCAVDWVDTPLGQQSCADVTGHTDVLVRVQRFKAGTADTTAWGVGSFRIEVQDIGGTPLTSYCSTSTIAYPCPITAATGDWSRMAGFVGNSNVRIGYSLAWLKWFSTTVEPGGHYSQEATPADLADFRFEGNLYNQGTGSYNVSIGALSGSTTYAASPSLSPTCVAGPQQVFRAGYPAQADGTGSYALNSDPSLTYLWQELSGPTEIQWDARDTATPTVTGTAFGSYVLQLTVTDRAGQSSTCQVKHGFVATNDKNVVITSQPAVDALLGNLIRYGTNPWPWADDRHRTAADFNAGHLSDYYRQFWLDTQGPGTIAVAANSTAVTGTGTDFTTRFCQGPANPTVARTAAGGQAVMILIWYPNSSPEGYGLRFMDVAGCTDDTHLTLVNAWNALGDAVACTSCSYSYDDKSTSYDGVWNYPEHAGSNFYDAVAAFYALYYRTGIDDYLTAARYLADNDWKYRLDSGTVCHYGPGDRCGGALAPRTHSLIGMVLRALDGRADMWAGLNRMFSYYMTALQTDDITWGVWDAREEAYHMLGASYCALFNPDATYRANCKSALSYAMSHLWSLKQDADGSWKTMYTTYTGNSWAAGTTVSLTNGSAAVVGNGTTFGSIGFMSGSWKNYPARTTHMVFFSGTAQPSSNSGLGTTYYTVSYVDDTHLTLDRAFTGTTGNYGYATGYDLCPNGCAVGYGAQPFMMGILGFGFYMTELALAESDPTNSAKAKQYNLDLANWQANLGYRTSIKGMQYIVGTVDCQPPLDDSMTWCSSGMTATQGRTLNAEALRSVMTAYLDSGDATYRSFADTIYNAMWAKPGTCPSGSALCVSDGDYLTDWNGGTGWYLTGNPWTNRWHKYFGMSFGIGAGADWPAVRFGKPDGAMARPAVVAFDLQTVPGAVSARVKATAPTGVSSTTLCSASPCTVTIDSREGDTQLWIEYLSAGGAVVASSQSAVMQGRH